MFPPIFVVCAADPGVASVLGTPPATRLFLFGQAEDEQGQPPAYPYAVWQLISGAPENYLSGRPDIDGFSLQVDVYSNTASSTREAAKAIRDAIELKANVTRWGGESRDPETGAYRVSFDVDWLTPR